MKRRTVIVSAVACTLAASGALVAAPANAASKRKAVPASWMTAREYRGIKVGESSGATLAATRKIVGARGRVVDHWQYANPGYCDDYNDDYTACSRFIPETVDTWETIHWRTSKYSPGGGSVTFHNGRAVSKAFYR